jgi:hypothetical protein
MALECGKSSVTPFSASREVYDAAYGNLFTEGYVGVLAFEGVG